MRGSNRLAIGVFLIALRGLLDAGPCGAQTGHALSSGAIGVGAGGSLISVEGTTTASLGLRLAYYQSFSHLTLESRASMIYARVSDLDRVDLELGVHGLRRLGASSGYPFVGVVAGVRQEWVGSFSQSRYPVGVDAGFLALVGSSASFDVAYEFRRLLDDPVNDFNEHRIVFGLSLLLRNH